MTTVFRKSFGASVLTYLCWSAALMWLVLSKRYTAFLAPRFSGVLVGAALLLLVFALAGLAAPHMAQMASGKKLLPSCLILLCPLGFLFTVPVGPAGSYAFEARSGEQTFANPYAGAANTSGDNTGPSQSLLNICVGFPNNVGQQVITEGMVTRDKDMPDGCIVLFRFAIVCCAADAQPVGILMTGEGLDGLPKDTWVRVSGKLATTRMKEQDIPTIHAETIERIQPPSEPYLY